MQRISLMTVAAIVALAFVLGACRSNAPIFDVADAPVVVPHQSYAPADVRRAIIRAGADLGWRMSDVDSNTLNAVLNVRDHMARVHITFDEHSYSIEYQDSDNLGYDNGTIHPNYNGWIDNLDRRIRANLQTL